MLCHVGYDAGFHDLTMGRSLLSRAFVCWAGIAAVAAQSITLQAEDAILSGVTVGKSVAGYTGRFFKIFPQYLTSLILPID